ncbi:hypothetical protein EIP91_001726 [Steccherinum ochraceum]|uniref:Protein kinase domain-containing protein n=1 Tax=Steccherinum ochraceum TaxID=92696 RepID=A0A4R0RFZ2_9APHY|nr:hypothetical protein EIP91_001726 [Steccherinum ochraceum]
MSLQKLRTIHDVQHYIRLSLSQTDETPLNRISSDDAQKVLDEVWKVLDSVALPLASTHQQFSAYEDKLRSVSIRLSILHGILSTALFLSGATCLDSNSLAGIGTFADVFVGTFRGEKVALKRLRVYMSGSQKTVMKQLFFRESLLWKNLVHEHIVPFIGVAEDIFPGTICMVIAWMDNGSLRSYMEGLWRKGELVEAKYVEATERWLLQIAHGLSYLHDEGLVHGDLHGENVLVDKDGNARLADFGMTLISESVAYKMGSAHGGGALRWKAPELNDPEVFCMQGTRPTKASDIFSYACITVELFSCQPPMPDLTNYQVSRRYVQGIRPERPSTPDNILMADPLWSLTNRCWSQLPRNRPSARHVIKLMRTMHIAAPPCLKKRPVGVLDDLRTRQRFDKAPGSGHSSSSRSIMMSDIRSTTGFMVDDDDHHSPARTTTRKGSSLTWDVLPTPRREQDGSRSKTRAQAASPVSRSPPEYPLPRHERPLLMRVGSRTRAHSAEQMQKESELERKRRSDQDARLALEFGEWLI